MKNLDETKNLVDGRRSTNKFSEVVANENQKWALEELLLHVFGSKENYFIFRESGKEFPKFYRNFKNLILLCNEDFNSREWFDNLINLCPSIEISINTTTYSSNLPVFRKDSKTESIRVDTKLAHSIYSDSENILDFISSLEN